MAKKPKLKFNVGEQISGNQLAATVLGYVLYKEYDNQDKKHYYFEEWELSGIVEFDSWIEYDHYSNKVSRYTPISRDFKTVTGGAIGATAEDDPAPYDQNARYNVASVAASEGNLSYPSTIGDQLHYLEVQSPQGKFVIERFANGDVDLYRQQEVTKAQQKELFGRVIAPSFLRRTWAKILMWISISVVIIAATFGFPSYTNDCTPRSTSTSSTLNGSSELSTSTSSETQNSSTSCRRRFMWNSGGGGAGK